jgi:hypothetical protein
MSATLLLYRSDYETVGPARFRKDVLRVGRWKHPLTGQDVNITPERLRALAESTTSLLETTDGRLPFPDGHTSDAKRNLGWWRSFEVVGDRLVGELEVTDEEAVRKIRNGSLRGVSAAIQADVRDTQGRVFAEAFTHVCATPVPVIDGQEDFQQLSREAGGADLYVQDADEARVQAIVDRVEGRSS